MIKSLLSRSLFLPIVVLALAPHLASADTVLLKGGEKVEGKILEENEKELTVEYKVSASITDRRTIQKSEVEKIEKQSPDEAAYLPLKGLKPGANSLQAAAYEGAMRPLQGFLNEYPKSAHAAEIGQQLAAFGEEKARVDAGEIKMGGSWISKEDVQKERYQLGAQVLLGQMSEQTRRGDQVGALNTFDQMEKSFSGSKAFPEGVTLARQVLGQLKPTADRALQTWQIQKKERDAANLLVAEPQRSELIARQKAEQTQMEQAAEAATKAGVKWAPFQPRNEKGLQALAAKVQPELKRLEVLPVAKMRESIQLAEAGRTKMSAADLAGAEESFRQATTLWGANELATRLQKELAPLKVAAKATPEPAGQNTSAPTATPAPAVPVAASTPAVAASPAPVAMDDEKPVGFFRTPLGLGVLVLLVLGGGAAYVSYKKKKQQQAEEEIVVEEE